MALCTTIVLPLLKRSFMKLMSKRFNISFIDFCLFLLLGATLCICYPYFMDAYGKQQLNSDAIDHIGSFIGGVATLISIYYLYKTLRSQEKGQAVQFFEAKYIELIKFYRDVYDKSSAAYVKEYGDTVQMELFDSILEQLSHVHQLVSHNIPNDISEFYQDASSGEYKKDKETWKDNLRARTILNIDYLVVLVGVKLHNQVALLKNKYFKKYKEESIKVLLDKLQMYIGETFEEPTIGLNPLQKAEKIANPDKYFHGYQKYVCNYFRTLYQAVCYVDKQDFLSDEEKYEYVKMLRGQLSNEEEKVLFFNSLSDLGMDWEYSEAGQKHKLITHYGMIKNVSEDEEGYLKVFYPEVEYENFD